VTFGAVLRTANFELQDSVSVAVKCRRALWGDLTSSQLQRFANSL
jgi:hypothetical protein